MKTLREHFDWVAGHDAGPRAAQADFHAQILQHYRRHIPAGSRVLEVGCGAGDLLAGLKPAHGVGVDFSSAMLAKARERHRVATTIEYRELDIQETVIEEKFDHVVLDYLTGYLTDIQATLQNLQSAAHERTRLHLTTLNTIWFHPLRLAERIGAVMPQPPSNWLSHHDLINLLELSGWEVISYERLQLFPFNWPLLSSGLNRVLVRLPFIRHFGITLAITARPRRACRCG